MRRDGSGSTTSVSVEAMAGEAWRVYGAGTADGIVTTSDCAGSMRLASSTPRESGSPPVADDDRTPRDGQNATERLPATASLALVAAAAGLVMMARRRRRR